MDALSIIGAGTAASAAALAAATGWRLTRATIQVLRLKRGVIRLTGQWRKAKSRDWIATILQAARLAKPLIYGAKADWRGASLDISFAVPFNPLGRLHLPPGHFGGGRMPRHSNCALPAKPQKARRPQRPRSMKRKF